MVVGTEVIEHMQLQEVLNITEARTFAADTDLTIEVRVGFASDLMSDVLVPNLAQGLLITGLTNPQVMRTAEMAEVAAVLMVRGKTPQPETLELSRSLGIPIIGTRMIMFEACGRLYQAGLPVCAWCEEG